MAKSSTTRRDSEREQKAAGAPAPPRQDRKRPRRKTAARKRTPVELDRVIHERVRLAIVSALAGASSLTFRELKDLLKVTDGNLSVHVRRLEEAGFVTCDKSFVDRVPRSEYQLTAAGRKALDEYLDHMESLIRRVREG